MNRREKEAVFTTIVGGRPPGSGMQIGEIPRGIEVLIKKASVDPEFRQLLLDKRGQAAREIGLELTEAERNMLSSIPAEQLEKIIDKTKVEPEERKIFLGKTAKLMLVAVAGIGVVSLMCVPTFTAGISPDRVRKMQMECSGDVDDVNDTDDVEPDSEAGDRADQGK